MSFDHPEFTLPLPTEALPLPLSVRSDGGGIDSSLLVLDLHLAPVTDGRSGPIATAADTAFESVLRAFVARGRSGALPPPFEILSAGDEQVVTSAYEGDPDGDDDGDGIPNKDDPDGDIVVTGKRPRVYEPNPGTDTGGGGGSSTGTGGASTRIRRTTPARTEPP